MLYRNRSLSLLYLLVLFAGTALASVSDPVMPTVWDRIMKEQSFLNLRKGYSLMEAERYAEAANEFLKALARTPSDPQARILYGSSLYWLGEPDKALAEFLAATELDPGNASAWQLIGIVYAWKGDLQRALANFLKASEFEPGRADVKMNLGSIYNSLGDMKTALDYFRAAVLIEPKNPLYQYQLGLLYGRLGRFTESASAFKYALSAFSEYEDAMLELAVLYEKDGKEKDAAKLYRRALAVKPGDNVARFRLACLLRRQGDTARLKNIVDDAFLLTPSNPKGGISISLAYAGGPTAGTSEDAPAAKSALENAVSKIPDDEDITVKAEFISVPKTQLVTGSETKVKGLKAGLERGYKQPEVKYMKRDYSMPASDIKGRKAKAAQISSELEKAAKEAAADGMDTRMSLNIETKKASPSRATGPGGDAPEVVYKPRDVGNDMGLWVMGSNWLGNVSDALEELEAGSGGSKDHWSRLLLGLGNLILGEADTAIADMEDSSGGASAELGRCAAFAAKGAQEKALDACRSALKFEPGNRIALANIKWLTKK